MKVTVCELSNDMRVLEEQWEELVIHIRENESDLVLLPEMPFYAWLADSREVDPARWQTAVYAHAAWIKRFEELETAVVAGTRPIIQHDQRLNEAYLWQQDLGYWPAHTKYYLPDDPGFWEATWYARGDGEFKLQHAAGAQVGFLICTEIWFNWHAHEYMKAGIQLLLCPRATPSGTVDKWIAGGRTAAVVSGAYCLSSNLGGVGAGGAKYGGTGWIIEPEEGQVLGLTSPDQPFLTLEISLDTADKAKQTYPRYVVDA